MTPILLMTMLYASDDGCKILMKRYDDQGYVYDVTRVVNPDECPDKGFVKYLNCSDLITPIEERPKECQE